MQATVQRFVISRTGITIFALSILLNVALLIIALDQAGALPSSDRVEQSTERPVAHHAPGMGEGLLSGALPLAALMPKAYDAPGMGEGRLNLAAAIPTMVTAHTAPGQGEGWLAYGQDNQVPACGPGEGLLNPDLRDVWSCRAP
jgi:hypothetical protein